MVFHPFAGFSIVTLGLHLAVDLRDTAFCFLYNALHFYGEGSFLTLPLALYRVNPLRFESPNLKPTLLRYRHRSHLVPCKR